MHDEPNALSHPELVIGIAGPIGIDINVICNEICQSLEGVDYKSHVVHVTTEMQRYPAPGIIQHGADYFNTMMFKMDYANKLCEDAGDSTYAMRTAVQAITFKRDEIIREIYEGKSDEKLPEVLPSIAYVIRQLKRPSEAALLRRIYGKQFILVSAYASEDSRRDSLREKIKNSLPLSTSDADIIHKVETVLDRDQDEGHDDHGQHLRDTFHLADVFVDGVNKNNLRMGLDRFFNSFFGKLDIGPTKWEYGMYAAKAASLRSIDLSRQVGAAIFSDEGDIIVQGCNEVPKAFGGTYWDGEEPDYRDAKLGKDPNDFVKQQVIRDLLERLCNADMLNISDPRMVSSEDFVDKLLGKGEKSKSDKTFGCLKNSQVNDLTEYGRVVHAEMNAICTAARSGDSVRGTTLFCTTFPCHNCTKHILSAGIRKVVYMEPYPKSRAKQLHHHEIEIERPSETRVSFVPFMGISPFRYRDIFEKRSRKKDGQALLWQSGHPRPMIDISAPAYLDIEAVEVGKLGGSIQPKLL